jgi:glycosyltransferase involved in cell wall biosynthesis
MKLLSIITINYNNASGLQKTMESVIKQNSDDFEYVVVDGGSSDNSVNIIKEITGKSKIPVKWVSEKDLGIYNAMNKGIKMSEGKYLQFLNSGDMLASETIISELLKKIPDNCQIIYGNMLKIFPQGLYRDKGPAGKKITMMNFYLGTLNHSPSLINRELFELYGLYDETLKIVADWKWFMQVIGIHNVKPVYFDLEVTVFDMTGISNTQNELEKNERRKVLESLLPNSVLTDYDEMAFPVEQYNRIKKYPLIYKFFWLIERMLFKADKYNKRKNFVKHS